MQIILFIDYYNSIGEIHKLLKLSFAMYLSFYKGALKDEDGYYGIRNGEKYKVFEYEYALEIYRRNADLSNDKLIELVMSDEKLWGMNLMEMDKFYEKVCSYVDAINNDGVYKVLSSCVEAI